MRNFKILTTGMLFLAMIFSVNTFAQRGYGNGRGNGQGYGQGNSNGLNYFCNNIPNLTTEQQTKITDLRTSNLKKMQNNRNQLIEKNARLQTLRSAENVNMKAINKTIDEIGVIKTNMNKSREQHFQDIRNILNAEQKVYFDSFNGRRGNGKAYGRGNGKRNGSGYGRGRGRCRTW